MRTLKTILAYRAQGADGNAAVIAAQVCAERGFEAMPCLGGGADAAPACADDPAWTARRDSCASYAFGRARAEARCAARQAPARSSAARAYTRASLQTAACRQSSRHRRPQAAHL